MSVPKKLRQLVSERDKHRCAYCLTTEQNCGLRMHIDHIIPTFAGGKTNLDNLCLACFSCNVYKGAKQTGIDPYTNKTIAIFQPLKQKWSDHFTWDENKTKIIGLTACGRATVQLLKLNNSTVVKARRRWVSAGWHPPNE
ncbi:MAG: HNH endonuclease [Anaerolineaceae bacterium 4572_78]|nr:MAG: HNH endonuclease [Anaerolineaceae bacterium 4572_78]